MNTVAFAMPQAKSIKVILNARSGVSEHESVRRRLLDIFEKAAVAIDISVAQNGAELTQLASSAVREGHDLIVAAGGDGTVSSVAAVVVKARKTLGVLPLGTLNHFARDLKIPLDLEAAAQELISGYPRRIDVGEVNGRIFLNNSSLGLYPTIVREREKQQRLGSGKWPAFIWAALTALRRYPFLDVRLEAGGQKFARRTPFVFIGNNEYMMERLTIGMREWLDKGQLSMYITNRTGRWGLVRLALRALFGHLREDKDFLALCTREVRITTRHQRVRVALDGEVDILETPLNYRVLPGALQVIVAENKT